MPFVLRSSDLYEFHQTVDLKHVNSKSNPLISQLCSELYSPQFLRVMETVTGRPLGNHVDISGQRYQPGDFLLCHDDRLEKRRIALILYLVEKDAVVEGGRLFAMRSDEEGRPVMNCPHPVTPKWNTLAFFEVSRFSFHQVEQVYPNSLVPRYSITCWFHDPSDSPTIEFKSPRIQPKFPIKFGCPFDLSDLLTDLPKLAHLIHRQYAHASYLSSAQYSSSHEPRWISELLTDSFRRYLEQVTCWRLDWPTKPVAWCLSAPEHFYLDDGQVDRQQDVEYNYKERSVSVAPPATKLHVSLIIKYSANDDQNPMTSFFKLHNSPLKIKKIPKNLCKIVLVTMKFNKI